MYKILIVDDEKMIRLGMKKSSALGESWNQ